MREIEESKKTLTNTQKEVGELVEYVTEDFPADPKVKTEENGGKK